MTEEEKIKKIANEMASLLNKNIRDVTTAITVNINYEKPHSILAAFAALYSVESYFEFKLNQMGISPDAIEKAKEGADKYVTDVISGDLGAFSINKGEA
jgi:hypothetical protein